ncbi:hypothetical protein MFLAVUS_006949 [Mucor flavus]|uniref:Uncharacterized protein n=1 Tax=Mucor flavus TaxID=439312 RepID=A0ABP9Z2Y6_9FUNG
MKCLNYMYNSFKNLENSFQNYQGYASGYDAYQDLSFDEYDMMENDEDEEYDYVDEGDVDILSAYTDEYDSDDEDYDTGVLSADEDETKYPPARTLDDPWGFINSGNLSVEFKNTTLAPKVVDMSLMNLAQAKKDYFERLVSVSKRNLSA